MIKYQLHCSKCNSEFESWFASSDKYENLLKKKLLTCINCGSNTVKKSLMSPYISTKGKKTAVDHLNKSIEIKKKLKEYKNFVEKNLDYVGDNFAYEARSIYYGNKKRKKGIFGKATKNDIEELAEEGIETQMIPWVEDKEN